MNKKKMIHKSLRGLKRYQILFVCSVLLCMFVFSYYVIMNQTKENLELEKTRQTFGNYTYFLSNLTEEKVKIIEQEENTKDFCLLSGTGTEKNCYLYADEKIFSFANFSLIEGNFPQTADEMVAPKWYLFQQGIEPAQMVGSFLTIPDPTTGEEVKKKVSGLYTVQDSVLSSTQMEEIPTFIFSKVKIPKEATFDIYVELKSVKNITSYMTQLKEKLELDEFQNYALNNELLDKMNASQDGAADGRKKIALYTFLLAVFLVFIGMVQKTLIHLCLARWRTVMSTYKLLGVNMNELRNYILAASMCQTLLGALLGVCLGFGTAYIFLKYSLAYWEIQVPLVMKIPYGSLLAASAALLVLTVWIVWSNIRKWNQYSAYAMLNETGKRTRAARKSFYRNGHFRRVKYAFGNCFYYFRQKSGIILTVVLCMLLVTFLDTQFEQSVKNKDNNNQYQYMFRVIDYFSADDTEQKLESVKQVYGKLMDLLKKQGKTIYYQTGFVTDFRMEKELLTKEYIEKLKTDLSGYYQYLNQSSTMEGLIAIMGYSPEMFSEMFGEDFKLGKNEAIMLNRTVDLVKNQSVPIRSTIGKTFSFDTFIEQVTEDSFDYKKIEKTVSQMTDNLVVYPDAICSKEYLCLLIDYEEYRKYFNFDFVNSFYVKSMTEDERLEVQRLLRGVDYIQVVNQEEELKEQNMNAAQEKFVLYMILILSNLLAGISLLLQEIQEMDIRKKDFDFMRILGISESDCSRIILLELILVNFAGLLFGYLLSKTSMVVLHEMAFLQSGSVNGILVLFCFSLSCLYTLISFLIVRKILKKQVISL